jgi:hydroxyversicolorone monooxygenase
MNQTYPNRLVDTPFEDFSANVCMGCSFPNFITFIGPTWPVENGSVMGPLTTVSHYALSCISKLQTESLHSFAPKQSVTDSFNAHVQTWIKKTVWTEDCRSWYKNNETGRVNAVWPGSSLHYQKAIARVRWEDMEMQWNGEKEWGNMWGWMGTGSTPEIENHLDVSPYLNVKEIDPKWLEAVGYKGDMKEVVRAEKDKPKTTELPVGGA